MGSLSPPPLWAEVQVSASPSRPGPKYGLVSPNRKQGACLNLLMSPPGNRAPERHECSRFHRS